MYHTHFNSIHSTQIYLRDNLAELKAHGAEILISASEQTSGIGRKGSQWDSYSNAIAMSFTLKPNPVPTLTPIEIGILAAKFLKNEYDADVFLKWPNDLLTSAGNKCGGIIAQYIDSETVIAGVGMNLGSLEGMVEAPDHYKHGLGFVKESLSLTNKDQQEIPAKLYEFILGNRLMTSIEIQTEFFTYCHHIGKEVAVDDDGFEFEGKFMGIGNNGEALVEVDGHSRAFLSSSLKILN